uniref:ATP-dependent DNA helicase n=1 Tax=Caenorhabditis japonica TaxID=281687 RepID=A0A8R1ETG8_CAEJA
MTTEFLNSVWTSSLPLRLCLKVGSVVMLLRNLDRKCILCTFATGSNKGKETFVPRKNELFIKYTSERLRNLRVQEIL